MEYQFSLWRDLANNIGVRCLMCGRTHWRDDFNDVIPGTENQKCVSCTWLKENTIRANAQIDHDAEVEVGLGDQEECAHPFAFTGSDLPEEAEIE